MRQTGDTSSNKVCYQLFHHERLYACFCIFVVGSLSLFLSSFWLIFLFGLIFIFYFFSGWIDEDLYVYWTWRVCMAIICFEAKNSKSIDRSIRSVQANRRATLSWVAPYKKPPPTYYYEWSVWVLMITSLSAAPIIYYIDNVYAPVIPSMYVIRGDIFRSVFHVYYHDLWPNRTHSHQLSEHSTRSKKNNNRTTTQRRTDI